MQDMILRLQKRNPLNMCHFFPINPNELEVISEDNEFKFKERSPKLNLLVLYEPNCDICVSQYILPFSKRNHHFRSNHYLVSIESLNIEAAKNYLLKRVAKKTVHTSFSQSEKGGEKEKKEEIKVFKKTEDKNVAEIKSTRKLIETTKNYINDNIKDLITEKINDDFSWGKYGDFNIIICNQNGYINGVQLIKEASEFERKIKGKDKISMKPIVNWFENEKTDSLLKTASIRENIKEEHLIFKKLGLQKRGEEVLKGIYLHPVLINSLAEWVSPSYALMVNEIINNLNIKKKLKEENNRIDELTNENNKNNNLIKQMREAYNNISTKHEMQIKDFNIVLKKLDTTVNKLGKTTGFIDSKKNDIRLSTNDDNVHYFYIYKIFNKDTGRLLFYSCCRTQPKNLYTFLDKLKNFRYKEFYKKYSVNSIQAWNKFKTENNKINIEIKGKNYNDFTFLNNYNEEKLIKDLDIMFSEFNDIIEELIN